MPNKKTKDFTEEERLKIVAKARNTSVRKAAEEFGISRYLVNYWVYKKYAVTATASKDIQAPIITVDSPQPTTETEDTITDTDTKEMDDSAVSAVLADEPAIDEKQVPLMTVKQVIATEKSVEPDVAEQTEAAGPTRREIDSLAIENAVLKGKIELLSHQLEKLRMVIADLTELDVKSDE